eukprot:2916266-Prymnesium_polylepis.1
MHTLLGSTNPFCRGGPGARVGRSWPSLPDGTASCSDGGSGAHTAAVGRPSVGAAAASARPGGACSWGASGTTHLQLLCSRPQVSCIASPCFSATCPSCGTSRQGGASCLPWSHSSAVPAGWGRPPALGASGAGERDQAHAFAVQPEMAGGTTAACRPARSVRGSGCHRCGPRAAATAARVASAAGAAPPVAVVAATAVAQAAGASPAVAVVSP